MAEVVVVGNDRNVVVVVVVGNKRNVLVRGVARFLTCCRPVPKVTR